MSTSTSQLLPFDLVPPEGQPISPRHAMRQRPDFLPSDSSLGKKILAGQTLGEVHIPGELVSTLIEMY